jgi:hypothetical protein
LGLVEKEWRHHISDLLAVLRFDYACLSLWV